jgi:hypothetical protein
MIVFWRIKGKGLIFYEADLYERVGGLVKLSESKDGAGRWYKEDELEIVIDTRSEEKKDES